MEVTFLSDFLIHWQKFNGNALYCISKFSACVLILLFLVFKIIDYVDVIEIALKLLIEYDTNEYYTSMDFSLLFSEKLSWKNPA